MGLLVINIGKVRGGRVATFKRGVWGTSSLDWKLGGGVAGGEVYIINRVKGEGGA